LRLGGLGSARTRSGHEADREGIPASACTERCGILHHWSSGITTRRDVRNLDKAGYEDYAKLYMVPNGAHFASAADFKTPIRVKIERAGYTIVANMGDQPSDLQGGHAEKKFLLPDPFYRVP
jgi:hypothetical protein